MELTKETLNKMELNETNETLFNMITVYKDDCDAKYICLSYEEESYLDEELIESLDTIIESEEDLIVNGSSIGTTYYLGYNI
jgi:hypothetical protein